MPTHLATRKSEAIIRRILSGLEQGPGALDEVLCPFVIPAEHRRQVYRNLESSLHGLAPADQRKPALQRREGLDLDAGPAVRADPREVGDVGDAVVSGQVLMIAQSALEYAEEPLHLQLVAIDGDLDLNGNTLSPGDGISLDGEKELRLTSASGAHFLLFDLN